VPNVGLVRGESSRVAARVRELLGERPAGAEPAAGVVDARDPDGVRAGWWPGLLARLPVRVDPGRRSALAVSVAVLVAALVTGGWVILQRPRAVPVSAVGPTLAPSATPVGSGVAPTPSGSGSPAPSGRAGASPGLLVVDVAGKVRRPGLYRLPTGSRIDDAVHAAGGSLAGVDLSSLNLAARVVDGQQILVGKPAVAPAPGGAPADSGATSAGLASGPVDLNTASLDQLQTLPGVGPVLAQHILDWRTAHGSFTSIDQLDDVSGIGTVKFAALRSLVAV
jgi:competence protein ComEA